MNFKILIISLLLTFSANFLVAQNDTINIEFFDVLYLKDGSEFRGKIKEYKPDEYVKIKIFGGMLIEFPAQKIRKIVQQPIAPLMTRKQMRREGRAYGTRERKPYNFREKGIYNETSLSLPGGYDTWETWNLGLGIHHVTGYQFNRWIGAGLGLGFEGYSMGYGENVVPIYAEARGYLLPKNVTPFYTLAFGYSIGVLTPNGNTNLTNAKGGMMLNPSIGYRFGASSGANFTLSMGYKLQQASFTESRWDGSIMTRKYQYNRINLKLGLLF